MMSYSWEDLEALRPEWERVFNTGMPMGFEITPDQVPMMKQCIEEKSEAPLEAYIASLDPLKSY